MRGLIPMDADILPPSSDWVFKRILTDRSADAVLKDLISAIIGRPVVKVELRNNELPHKSMNEKEERLDVNCSIDDGTQIDLEMQASRFFEPGTELENLTEKSILYMCALHASQSAKGKDYSDLVQTWQVTLCTYPLFLKRDNFVNFFSMRHDQDNKLLSDSLHVVFIELSKLVKIMKKSIEDMTDLEKWSIFFGYADKVKYRETVNQVIKSKEAIMMAGELLMSVSQNANERAAYLSHMKFVTDLEAIKISAQKAGRAEEKDAMIRNFKALGVPLETIAQASGMSVEYVTNLQ